MFIQLPKSAYPPGLAAFAEKHKLPESHVKQITQAYGTIRGRPPKTEEEWATFYAAIQPYLTPEAK